MNNNVNNSYNSQLFSSNTDIDNFFRKLNSNGFVDWFNTNISKLPPWQKDELNRNRQYKINKANWSIIWNYIPVIFGRPNINLVEFICMNSIMTNETGGEFVPGSELVNKTSNIKNPGIAYEFNDIGKKSYNTLVGNKTAYQLFHDSDYIAAHGTKGMSNILKNTSDSRWSGSSFPVGFSNLNIEDETSSSGKANGFLIEADFFKFRGRGFIQTTNRVNYKDLILFVINYNGDDPSIISIKNQWSKYGNNLDKIATCSTNEQWDLLFQHTNYIVANYAVYVHSKQNRNYSTINPDQLPINLTKSIEFMGKSISGSYGAYSKLFVDRVKVQLDLINSNPIQPIANNNEVNKSDVQEQEISRTDRTGQDPNTQTGTDNGINGNLSNITNVFVPSIKPSAITFNINGE